MASPEPSSLGRDLSLRLMDGVDEVRRAPLPGARDLPVVAGLTPKCVFTDPLENVRAAATRLLVESGKVLLHGDDVVFEAVSGHDRRLVTLARAGALEPAASAIIANLMICEHAEPGREPVQFAPPQAFVSLLLNSSEAREALPAIRCYAPRPLFDDQFHMLSPGWHPESSTLVHGPEVEPLLDHAPPAGGRAHDRLPPRLKALLAGFCFRSPADLVAAVAAMLTGLLANHFVASSKALVLVDGNQPGLGKTLLARVLGLILDGADPRLIHYAPDDEELAKRICSTVRAGGQSVVIIDNAKLRSGGSISSPVLEANSMAPQLSLRILGQSANFTRSNDLVWVVTMNDTKTSPDLVTRGMPIRLKFEGDPRHREFAGLDPVGYAAEHRVELLGELAGMVIRWDRAGRPGGSRRHRCDRWARVVGGILEVAALPEFLSNLDEAAASFNQALDELSALAEAAAANGERAIIAPSGAEEGTAAGMPARKKDAPGLSATEWEPLFRRAGIQGPALDAARSSQAKATILGNFLSVNVDREVPIESCGVPGRAKLVASDAGKRQKRYAFSITWDEGVAPPSGPGGDRPPELQAALQPNPQAHRRRDRRPSTLPD